MVVAADCVAMVTAVVGAHPGSGLHLLLLGAVPDGHQALDRGRLSQARSGTPLSISTAKMLLTKATIRPKKKTSVSHRRAHRILGAA